MASADPKTVEGRAAKIVHARYLNDLVQRNREQGRRLRDAMKEQ